MKIFVTGYLGFIGGHLLKKLKELKYQVKGFDIKASESFDFITDDKQKVQCLKAQDIRKYDRVYQSMRKFKPDIVIHLAALAGVRNSVEEYNDFYTTNINGTHNVLRAAVSIEGVSKVLVASSSSVYGDCENPLIESKESWQALSPYAISKRGTEEVAKYFSKWLQVITFRPFTVFGSEGRSDMVLGKLFKAIKTKTAFTQYGDGSSSRGYTSVHDLIDGIIKLMDYNPKKFGHNYELFNLGGQEEIHLKDLIRIVEEEKGKFKIKIEKHHFADPLHNLADISKAKNLIGFNPKRSFEKELRKLCAKK